MKAYEYETLDGFYPYYLSQHRVAGNRRMHYLGDLSALTLIAAAVVNGPWWLVLFAPFTAYGLAWIGHYFIEHNKPAAFHNPLFSFLGNAYMLRDVIAGRLKF